MPLGYRALQTAVSASQPHIINQKWLASNIWIRDVFLLLVFVSGPSAFGTGPQRSQPKHASNLDSVIKMFNPLG